MLLARSKNRNRKTMTPILPFIIGFAIAFVITYNWLKGIDYMKDSHPNYKGKDLFGEDEETK
jgi:hypothetical protein